LSHSDYLTPPKYPPSSGVREALIAAGAIVPAESRGTHATYVHPDPTLKLRGDEDASPIPWSQLRKEDDR
jgi:hypothetical protein